MSAASPGPRRHPTLLIANPSADTYGSDLQMVQTVIAMRERGWRVVVVMPSDGPLVHRLTDEGAEVRLVDFPVLRRSSASARGVLDLAKSTAQCLPRLRRFLKDLAPDVVYANTVTVPWWLIAARATRVPSMCHVHEADARAGRSIGLALNAPLFLAQSIVANGNAAVDATTHDLPALKRRTVLISNGVQQPQGELPPIRDTTPFRLAVVGRLSPRKAPDIALEAVAILRSAGRDVRLEICGTPFNGYEWFEEELRLRASKDDLAGAVTFSGYVSPIWPALGRADALVAPCSNESFGNAVVEAQLAGRPVVAAAAGGHLETVLDEQTGLLVPPHDAKAMATAVERLMDEPLLAQRIAERAEQRADDVYSVARYGEHVATAISSLLPSSSDLANHRAGVDL